MNKEKFTRVGFEPVTTGLTRQRSTSQKSLNHILPFSQGSRPCGLLHDKKVATDPDSQS